jgi:hypothetical protein
VVDADLTAFSAAITMLEGVKDKPRESIVTRSVATVALPDTIGSVRGIYRNELDKMMTKFKASAPNFYSAYAAARVIVNRPETRKKKE